MLQNFTAHDTRGAAPPPAGPSGDRAAANHPIYPPKEKVTSEFGTTWGRFRGRAIRNECPYRDPFPTVEVASGAAAVKEL
jgi:hypothetical protein